jgi:hypothetical protein
VFGVSVNYTGEWRAVLSATYAGNMIYYSNFTATGSGSITVPLSGLYGEVFFNATVQKLDGMDGNLTAILVFDGDNHDRNSTIAPYGSSTLSIVVGP